MRLGLGGVLLCAFAARGRARANEPIRGDFGRDLRIFRAITHPPCPGSEKSAEGGPREGHAEGRAEESDDGEEHEEIREVETNPASFSALNSTETSRIPLRDPARFPDLSSSHNKPLPCWARH